MKSLAPEKNPAPLSHSQKAALVELLTDDDSEIYRLVRGQIVAHGRDAGEWMRSFSLSPNPTLRRRTQEIVRHFDQQTADIDFLAFCLKHGEDLDLENGCWLLSKTQYPEINIDGYKALLDTFVWELKGIMNFGAEPEGMLADINALIYTREGFSGDGKNHYDPANFYLSEVVNRRKGGDICLGLIYLFVCQRLTLSVTGIGMPGNFLCRFQTLREEIYIDSFHEGRLLTKKACVRYLKQSGRQYHEKLLAPITPRQTLLRICSNLHQIYVDLSRVEERDRLQRYVVALSR
ncbi:MAG: regulator of sirC expression with transglutaminase-like and TPR domain [Candidatus Binatia bacterium]|jgi:regulator of sirC expression with transglutaminase-like and TPR domain